METVGTLKEAVLTFVYNNTNAKDAMLGVTPKVDMDGFMDKAALRAINNARLWAERGHDFGNLQVTVPVLFQNGLGVNLNRLYLDDYAHEPVGVGGGSSPAYVEIAGTALWPMGVISFPLPLQRQAPGVHWFKNSGDDEFLWSEDFSQWYLKHGATSAEWYSSQPENTPYDEIEWATSDPEIEANNFVISEEFPAVVAPTLKGRYTGNGELLIAIPTHINWWGTADRTKLREIQLGVDGGAESNGVKPGLYTVWGLEKTEQIDSIQHNVYRMNWVNPSITRPTNWQNLFVAYGPAYFCDYCRMNNLQGASLTNEQGLYAGPLPIKTLTGAHKEQQTYTRVHGRWWPQNETDRNRDWPVEDMHLAKVGSTLALAPGTSQKAYVNLFGIRWMDTYTSDADTDFLIQDGFDFMMWQAVLELNKIVKEFVPRAEGALPEPTRSRDEAWANLTANAVAAETQFFQD